MFYVQHLLGIGHIRRAVLLNRAMVDQGFEVLVVLGGQDVAGLSFEPAQIVRLPSAHVTDHTFAPLRKENGDPVDEAWKQHRTELLLQTYEDFQPDVILTEMFPFGRRQFRFELLPLLKAAKAAVSRPKIVCSVRDILVNKNKPGRDQETAAFVHDHYDLVLVHGDPQLTKLSDTFRAANSISEYIRYTGYVAPKGSTSKSLAGQGEVIVSAGGGAVGGPLFKTALQARALSKHAHKTWRLITGPNYEVEAFKALVQKAPRGVIVERFRTDLPHMFNNCALSISQGGYNTLMDVLRAKTAAVVVPYQDGSESEQRHRADLLAERNMITVVIARNVTAKILAQAIDSAQRPCDGIHKIDFDGAEASARLIAQQGTGGRMA
ncbi:MAG: glycosyl transferase [Magnetovibrio sp.]|nr:glycosyl transferase [Magnetovibrio sp.]